VAKGKCTEELAREIVVDLEARMMKHSGNVTKVARSYGLTRHELMGGVQRFSFLREAYDNAWEALLDECVETWMKCGAGKLKGVNTQATGRILAAKRPNEWAPVTKVDESPGYRRPDSEDRKEMERGFKPTVLRGGKTDVG